MQREQRLSLIFAIAPHFAVYDNPSMTSVESLVVGVLIGVVVGGLFGWWIARRRSNDGLGSALETELRRQLDGGTAEKTELRAQLSQANTDYATAKAQQEGAVMMMEQQQRAHEQGLAEARLAQKEALEELRNSFKALSAEALEKAQPQLLTLANETFAKFHETAKGELVQRQQAIETLVKPLEGHLRTYQERLQQSELQDVKRVESLKHELQTLTQQSQLLSQQTLQLRLVLSNNQARGRWGEETLRRVVEAANLCPHCDFTEQAHSGEGKPDLIVRLPGDRIIVVDAKVPDLEFLNALEMSDPALRAKALVKHASNLRATIKALAERDYPRQFPNALDYVVLFLPAESLFSAALEADRDLIVWAATKQIMLATPASLIALLRAVSFSWQQHKQTENAHEIVEAARELFSRICTFAEHLEKIRSGLERANKAFNDAVGSYDRSVRPSGDRLLERGGGSSGKQLADLAQLDGILRLAPGSTDEEQAKLSV